MAELRYSIAAQFDLTEIEEYGAAEFGPRAAEAYVGGLIEALDVLTRYPHSAPARPEYGEGIRCKVFQRHLILYTLDDAGVFVVRVLHHSRDVGRALNE